LCAHGLVERRPHPSDRRANRLYITAKGRATLARLVPLGRAIAADLLAGFGEAEAGALLARLLRIKGNIRKAGASGGARRSANGVRHAG
jgi:MarR family transcriptional regulator for hemolysin